MKEFWLFIRSNNWQTLTYYLILFLLPTQFGKHFWPDFSFIQGLRIDYLSPTLYIIDILILILIINVFIKICKKLLFERGAWRRVENYFLDFSTSFSLRSKNKKPKFIKHLFLISFLAIVIIGIFFSKSPLAGWYGFAKFLELLFFGYFTSTQRLASSVQRLVIIFAVGIMFESCLAILQFFNQGSLGGLFYFFGERFFNGQTPGIANASINGNLILRPYGTFSHPNVLAGYLIIAMAIIIFNFKFLVFNQFSIFNFKKYFYILSLILGTVALFLTLSRVAIILWVLILIKFLLKFKKSSIFVIAVVVVAIFFSPFISGRFMGLFIDESVSQRIALINNSLTIISQHPLFGVGLNNYLSGNILQPVHNIYLLIAQETGIVGLLLFLVFVRKTFARIKARSSIIHNSKFIILLTFLFLGLFDHYFLTIQQGQLLFAFVFGLCWQKA